MVSGTLTVRGFLGSLRGVEECAWFHRRDLRPFLGMLRRLLRKAWRGVRRRLTARPAPPVSRNEPVGARGP